MVSKSFSRIAQSDSDLFNVVYDLSFVAWPETILPVSLPQKKGF
jgi:hypothetical protein